MSILYNEFKLNKDDSTLIENILYSKDFPWFFSEFKNSTVSKKHREIYKNNLNIVDKGQLVHEFISTIDNKITKSNYIEVVDKILQQYCNKTNIKEIDIIRVKANLVFSNSEYNMNTYSVPHKDYDFKHTVLIYYVNQSVGDTILFDDNLKNIYRIPPEKGKLIAFNGNILHSAGHPFSNETRCVINFNVRIKNA